MSSGSMVAATAPARQQPVRGATPVRRSSATTRKAPLITINYAYLRRDIMHLAWMAPAMVVLLILAFIFFR